MSSNETTRRTTNTALEEAKRLALMHAQANTKTYFISSDSKYGNLILPVIPRLEDLDRNKEAVSKNSK